MAGCAEIVRKRLSFLSEGLFEEGDEWGFFDAETGETRREVPSKDGGVDLGRRRKGVWRQGEERFGAAVELERDGEQAVVA